MPFNLPGPFDDPVGSSPVFKATFITDKLFQFSIFVLSSGNSENFFPFHPHYGFPAAFRAIAVRIEGICKPNTAFKPESLVGERSHGANIDHIARKIVVDRFLYQGADFGMIATAQHSVHPAVGDLVGDHYAAVA